MCDNTIVFLQDGMTALYYAAWSGHNDVVSLLVDAHADVNLPQKVMLMENSDLFNLVMPM